MIKLIKSAWSFAKTACLLLVLACIVIFMIDNRQPVSISFYPLPFVLETKVYFVMLVFFLFGLFLGMLSFSKSWIMAKFSQIKHLRTITKLRRQLDQHVSENSNNN